MPGSTFRKSSFQYYIVYWIVFLYHRLYYRSFHVVGRENIPGNSPVIFAGNHQNALMDALSVLFAAHRGVVFASRADLFKKKWIAAVLHYFRMMPIYRIRDGISSMSHNDETFEHGSEVLRQRLMITLFPEGNHDGFKRLRPLKKGICRIAFLAEEKSDFNLGVVIIPTGIDYSLYNGWGSRLLVKYGKPIFVADFIPAYKENPQKALSLLKDAISAGLAPLMINIASVDHYDTYMQLCEIFVPEKLIQNQLRNTHHNRLLVSQEIISSLDKLANDASNSAFSDLKALNGKYQNLLAQYGLKDGFFRKGKSNLLAYFADMLISLALIPLYVSGFLLNYLPYKLPYRFTRNIKDHVFDSSFHFGISLGLFPVYYLFILLLFSLLTKGILIKLLFIFFLPASGLFALYFYKHLIGLAGKFRYFRLRFANRKSFNHISETRVLLMSQLKSFLNAS